MSATSSSSSGSPGAPVVDVEQLRREAEEVVDRARPRHRGDGGGVHVPVRGDDEDRARPGHRLAERPPRLGVPVLLERVHRVAVPEERGRHDGHRSSPPVAAGRSSPPRRPRRGRGAQPPAAPGAAPGAATARRPRRRRDVARVGQRAPVQRQAAAADAGRQPVAQLGQCGDLLVQPVPPVLDSRAQSVAVGGRSAGRVSSAARISGSESPTLRPARMSGQPAQHAARDSGGPPPASGSR